MDSGGKQVALPQVRRLPERAKVALAFAAVEHVLPAQQDMEEQDVLRVLQEVCEEGWRWATGEDIPVADIYGLVEPLYACEALVHTNKRHTQAVFAALSAVYFATMKAAVSHQQTTGGAFPLGEDFEGVGEKTLTQCLRQAVQSVPEGSRDAEKAWQQRAATIIKPDFTLKTEEAYEMGGAVPRDTFRDLG